MVWLAWRGRRAKYAIQLIDSGLLIMDFSDGAGNSFRQDGADQSMQYVQKKQYSRLYWFVGNIAFKLFVHSERSGESLQ